MATQIGERIMERRKELGLTQEELAHRMGYKTKSAINKIELGINDVSQRKVVRFAEALNTSIAYLMGWNAEDAESARKKGGIVADAALRMKNDPEFLSVVEKLLPLDSGRLEDVDNLISIFLK